MLVPMRDSDGNLVSKDILDINFDMKVEKTNDNKYKLKINKNYYGIETYKNKDRAEKELLMMIDARNQAEADLRSF